MSYPPPIVYSLGRGHWFHIVSSQLRVFQTVRNARARRKWKSKGHFISHTRPGYSHAAHTMKSAATLGGIFPPQRGSFGIISLTFEYVYFNKPPFARDISVIGQLHISINTWNERGGLASHRTSFCRNPGYKNNIS